MFEHKFSKYIQTVCNFYILILNDIILTLLKKLHDIERLLNIFFMFYIVTSISAMKCQAIFFLLNIVLKNYNTFIKFIIDILFYCITI